MIPFSRQSAITFLLVLSAINFADKAVIGLVADTMSRDLHLSSAQWGLVGGSFYLLFSLAALCGGVWSDRIGPKAVLALLGGVWAGIQLVTMWIVGFPLLLASRILLGAAEGPFYGTAAHALSKWLPPSKQGMGMALVTLGSAAGPAVIAPLLSLLILYAGWRISFGVLGALGLIWLLAWLALREPRPVLNAAAPPPTAVPWKLVVKNFFTARVLLLTFAGFAAYAYLSLLVVWVPAYWQQARHLAAGSPLYLLGVFLPWACGGTLQVVLSWLADRLQKRSNAGRLIVLAGALIVGAFLLVVAALTSVPLLAVLALSLMPIGVVFPLVAASLTALAPRSVCGAIQGTSVALYSLGAVLVPTIVGVLVQRLGITQGFVWTWISLAILLGVAASALIVEGSRTPRTAPYPAFQFTERTQF